MVAMMALPSSDPSAMERETVPYEKWKAVQINGREEEVGETQQKKSKKSSKKDKEVKSWGADAAGGKRSDVLAGAFVAKAEMQIQDVSKDNIHEANRPLLLKEKAKAIQAEDYDRAKEMKALLDILDDKLLNGTYTAVSSQASSSAASPPSSFEHEAKQNKLGGGYVGPEELRPKTAEEWRAYHAKLKKEKMKKSKGDRMAYDALEIGKEYKGIVKLVNEHGAFIDIKAEGDGFCHVSRLRDDFVKQAEDVVKKGDFVTARVLSVDPKKGKTNKRLITLSLQSDAMHEVELVSVTKYKMRMEKKKMAASGKVSTGKALTAASPDGEKEIGSDSKERSLSEKQKRRNQRRLAKQGREQESFVPLTSSSTSNHLLSSSSSSSLAKLPSASSGSSSSSLFTAAAAPVLARPTIVASTSSDTPKGKGAYPSNSKRQRDESKSGGAWQQSSEKKPRLPPTIIQPSIVFGAGKKVKFD